MARALTDWRSIKTQAVLTEGEKKIALLTCFYFLFKLRCEQVLYEWQLDERSKRETPNFIRRLSESGLSSLKGCSGMTVRERILLMLAPQQMFRFCCRCFLFESRKAALCFIYLNSRILNTVLFSPLQVRVKLDKLWCNLVCSLEFYQTIL